MAGDVFAGGVESSLRLLSFSLVLLSAVVVGDGDVTFVVVVGDVDVSFVDVGGVVVELSVSSVPSACDSGQIYE